MRVITLGSPPGPRRRDTHRSGQSGGEQGDLALLAPEPQPAAPEPAAPKPVASEPVGDLADAATAHAAGPDLGLTWTRVRSGTGLLLDNRRPYRWYRGKPTGFDRPTGVALLPP